MKKKLNLLKVLAVFIAIAVLICVALAIAAFVYHELLLMYQCAIITTHLLLITFMLSTAMDELELMTEYKKEPNGGNE